MFVNPLNNSCQINCPSNWLFRWVTKFIGLDVHLVRECVSQCTPNEYIHNGSCVTSCPTETVYISEKQCLNSCPLDKPMRRKDEINNKIICLRECSNQDYIYDNFCINQCPKDLSLAFNRACVDKCPQSHPFQWPEYGHRRVCVDVCPQESIYFANNVCFLHCPAEKSFYFNKTCKKECPAEFKYVDRSRNCVNKCGPDYFISNNACVEKCEEEEYEYNGTCVSQCPLGMLYMCSEFELPFCGNFIIEYPRVCRSCVAKCPDNMVRHNETCVNICPAIMATYNKTCFDKCPSFTPFYRYNVTLCNVYNFFYGYEIVKFCLEKCYPNELLLMNATEKTTKCVSNCPEDRFFIWNNTCGSDACNTTYSYKTDMGIWCRDTCPSNLFALKLNAGNATCVSECPTERPFAHLRECLLQCPKGYSIVLKRCASIYILVICAVAVLAFLLFLIVFVRDSTKEYFEIATLMFQMVKDKVNTFP